MARKMVTWVLCGEEIFGKITAYASLGGRKRCYKFVEFGRPVSRQMIFDMSFFEL